MEEVKPAEEGGSAGQNTSSSPAYAFLVHSQSSLAQDGTPRQDGGPNVKARRKRTSPQDHAVLEAAYLRNSKPDKNERAEIVSRVQLGEKEVQIWFQNRRQNDRRRSRPLQPHELIAHLRNTPPTTPLSNVDSSVPPTISQLTKGTSPTPLSQSQTSPSSANQDDLARPASRASSIRELLNPTSSVETTATAQPQSSQNMVASTPSSSIETMATQVEEKLSQESVAIMSDGNAEPQSSPLESGKKRAHEEMMNDGGNISLDTAPNPTLKRSSSMRLAMTVDGAVKIRTNNEPTPSPPKQRVPPPPASTQKMGGLSRSKSAIDSFDMFRDIETTSKQPRTLDARFGRSRDARTWEFYCDNNSKDALSTQAEAESTGSAIGAINLIRSNGHKSRLQTLTPTSNKTNVRVGGSGTRSDKPKMVRAKSSMASLHGVDAKASSEHKPHHGRSPSGDSDKENWAPGTRSSIHPMRRTQPGSNHRPILQDNEGIIFQEPRSNRKPDMPSGNDGLSPSKTNAKGEELDCIKGLLSLSQGAWR